MPEGKYVIAEAGEGQRIDLYLASYFPTLSRTQLQGLCQSGQVLLNGQKVKAGYKLKKGDVLSVNVLPADTPFSLRPEKIPLSLVFEDEDLLVVNKPRGMLVYPAGEQTQGTLVNALLAHYPPLAGGADVRRPGIVHRLDRDTTGLLVVAKNDEIYQELVGQFQNHLVRREYLVLAAGLFSEPGGIIEAPLGRNLRNRRKMAVAVYNSKPAFTEYEVLERLGDYTLLRCRLQTGRTHQIRVHLSYLSHPVVGDLHYGKSGLSEGERNKLGLAGQALHAFLLGFQHPREGQWREFTIPPPADFRGALQLLGSKKIGELFPGVKEGE